ncbi:PD-(D/E)XK nuclease family protein [Candidatus Poriferisodalis multihospitum]|uniref:PD-(D/E)XK nuclease family protein n=1 Tax=Candidatus Poriferisodalis multihospitum TaxID=2983191 RepID=UPI002B263B2B|nr:PD-(D/E)XK nuclease family protein [Candidatus Poriferisodalis multihospitum]
MTETAPGLLPAQQATLDVIRVPAERRPTYPTSFAADLRAEAEAALAGLIGAAGDIDSRGLWVSKRDLAGVFGCEARHLADSDAPFEWTVPTARGTVLHKAVELSTHRRFEPEEAVDAALERLVADDDNLGSFLAEASDGERADLTANCVALLTRFGETFPPMQRAWRPAAEVRARARLCGGAFVLSGKYDLTLGSPAPLGGPDHLQRAGKVIIDLKTGSRTPTDPEDLRFYALVETLSVGVPPLGIGSFYVAEGRIEHEAVTAGVLDSALRRTVDGIGRLITLRTDRREPRRVPGPPCRWCPISADCEPGQVWLSDPDD